MNYAIKSSFVINKVRGKDEFKTKYIIEDLDKNEFIALTWESIKPIVYDKKFDEELSKYAWCYHNSNGYAFTINLDGSWTYMHNIIAKLNDINSKVKHRIDTNRSDNRISNIIEIDANELQSLKNRIDKKPPPQELIDKGISELPKYMRWDDTNQCFVIEKHPIFKKSSRVKGTQKKNLNMLEKYNDALIKLQKLDDELYTEDEKQQIIINKNIDNEYKKICLLI